MHTYNFEKLEIWQKSKTLVTSIYTLTNSFPEVEKFGLTNQLRRAAVSITSNIAEGVNRSSNKEKLRFIEIAYSSLIEVLSLLIIAMELNLLQKEDMENYRILINEISNKINAFSKKIG